MEVDRAVPGQKTEAATMSGMKIRMATLATPDG
jgi:hypothetical protein